MPKIKRFFECLLPISVCNLACSYCYVIQENRRAMKNEKLTYTPAHIAKALRQERVGGTCLISLCGVGETMAQHEIVPLVRCLLQEGHFVNITTNGTLCGKYDELIEECGELIDHLHLSFSLHYVELLRRGWIDRFFDNVQKMRNAGASVLVQFNLCDDYLPYLEQIKQLCVERVGALPQVALTRNEKTTPMSIMTSNTAEEYYQTGKQFESPLFDFTFKNFKVKRNEYCYAGEWSGVLDMKTGIMKKCYAEPGGVDIFKNIDEPILFEAVGCGCHNSYCINSSHFMSLGVIPAIKTPTYAALRNRKTAKWYSEEMNEFLSSKLEESNKQHHFVEKIRRYGFRGWLREYSFYQKLHELKVKLRG